MSRADVLISTDELAAALDRDDPPLVLDVRYGLTDPPGAARARYDEAHLPGSRFVDLESELTAHTGDPRDGRHPLPDRGSVRALLAALGATPERPVVVLDEPGSFGAGRAWWVLRWAGQPVRVLDGGITAWVAEGRPTEQSEPLAPTLPGRHGVVPATAGSRDGRDMAGTDAAGGDASSAVPTLQAEAVVGHEPEGLPTVDADGAAAAATRPGSVLVDVRAPERYRGEVEPMDPVAGHIPGAVNVPVGRFFGPDGRLPDDEALRAAFGEVLDADEITVYCGSGVSAAQEVLALAALGRQAALFPGSWSAWSNDSSRDVATCG